MVISLTLRITVRVPRYVLTIALMNSSMKSIGCWVYINTTKLTINKIHVVTN